jgi:hypothetical protein
VGRGGWERLWRVSRSACGWHADQDWEIATDGTGLEEDSGQQGLGHPGVAQQSALPTRTRSTARRLVSIGPIPTTVAADVHITDSRGGAGSRTGAAESIGTVGWVGRTSSMCGPAVCRALLESPAAFAEVAPVSLGQCQADTTSWCARRRDSVTDGSNRLRQPPVLWPPTTSCCGRSSVVPHPPRRA